MDEFTLTFCENRRAYQYKEESDFHEYSAQWRKVTKGARFRGKKNSLPLLYFPLQLSVK